MNSEPSTFNTVVHRATLVTGIVAVVFGLAVLLWPDKAAAAVTGIIAVYAIVSGALHVATGFAAKGLWAGARIGYVLLGILFALGGILAFTSLAQSAAFLGVFVTVMVGAMWIIEGFASLFTVGLQGSVVLSVIYAVISVLAGFSLLSSPLWGAAFLWTLVGIAMVVIGAVHIIRFFTNKPKAD